MENLNEYLSIALIALVAGYILFLILLKLVLPRKLRSENQLRKTMLIKDAQQKAQASIKEIKKRLEDELNDFAEDFEQELNNSKETLNTLEADLNMREEELTHAEERISKHMQEVEALKQRFAIEKNNYEKTQNELSKVQDDIRQQLAQKTQLKLDNVREQLRADLIDQRKLEVNQRLRILEEELSNLHTRLGNRVLARTQARYEPSFKWPKGVSYVEVTDPRIADLLSSEENPKLISDLIDLSEGVNISYVRENNATPLIRLGGGYGIYKEAAKLTLEELLNASITQWAQVAKVYQKHRSALEAEALQLGKRAITELQLENMHIEIIKMIGALNWRTSYRQNQYYHSLEVARLAGLLADELGVDASLAKRCGILHDIGKTIDYRIEGSHAIISGDYADRYGESKVVCDTIMSHHADLIVETPLAYVLMAADTLSGARPGARVNLEEGYQERLSGIDDVIRAFPGVIKIEIMNGAREVHVEVAHNKVKEEDLESLSHSIARQLEEKVAFPGQIKVLIARRFEVVAVA